MAIWHLSEFPLPQIKPLMAQFALEHVSHILANDWHELESVVRTHGCYVEILCATWVWTNAKVQVSRQSVPV